MSHEILLVVIVLLLLFGPSKLPGLGKSMGEAIRGFKKGLTELDEKPAEIEASKSEQLPTGQDLNSQGNSSSAVNQKSKEEKIRS